MKGREEFLLFSATFMLVRPQEVVLSGQRMSVVFVMGCVWHDKTRFSQLEFRSVTNLRSSRTLGKISL
jgi:G:T-mismatch repair DNA endonuclease (very short patch repair protein)